MRTTTLLLSLLTFACGSDAEVNKITDGNIAGDDDRPDDTSAPINTAPDVTVFLVPAEVFTNDTLTADAVASDTDGDALTLSYAFSVDGAVVQDGPDATLSGIDFFDKGQVVTVTATATDGTDGVSQVSDPVTVLNTPPTEPVVSITGCADGWTLMPDGLRCAKAFDTETDWMGSQENCRSYGGHLVRIADEIDNDFVVDLYAATGAPSVWFHAGLTDELEEGTWVWTDGVDSEYRNWDEGRPDIPEENCLEVVDGGWGDTYCEDTGYTGHVCQVSPSEGPLTCTIDEESTDADEDPISYAFDWDVDGTEYDGPTVARFFDGDTVPEAAIGYEETWTCTVTPNDGEQDGNPASASFTTEEGSLCVSGDETFTSETVGAGLEVQGAVVEDIDGDGFMDVAVNEQLDNRVRIFWGDGTGSFASAPQTTVGIGRSGAPGDIEDINNDGHMDLMWGSQDANTVWVVLGTGDRNFAGASTFSQSGGPNRIKLVDLNGDGNQDALIRDRFGSCLSRRFGNGDGTFGDSTCFLSNGNAEAGDLDGDGLVEILMTYGSVLTKYELDESGDVVSESAIDPFPFATGGTPHLIDLDFDGDQDFMVFQSESIAVYKNDGLGNFEGCMYAVGLAHHMSAVGFLSDDEFVDYVSYDTCSYCSSEVHFVIHD